MNPLDILEQKDYARKLNFHREKKKKILLEGEKITSWKGKMQGEVSIW